MTKKKKDDKQEKEEVVLTEWQKRNIEFLKRKKAQKEEAEEKLRERKERFHRANLEEKEEGRGKSPKTAPEEEKTPKKPKKKKRPSKKIKALKKSSPVLIVASLVMLVSLFLISPFSKQGGVTVTGNSHVLTEELLQSSGIKKTDYISSLYINHASYEAKIKASSPWVKSARLTYQFPNRFELRIKEYDVLAYTQTDSGYQPILETGARVEAINASELPEKYLVINLSDEAAIQKLNVSLSKLDKNLVKEIKTINSADSKSTTDLLSLEMHDGHMVRVPLSEIETKLPYYDKIKKTLQDATIVDMEVGIYTTTADIEAQPAPETSESSETTVSTEQSNGESASAAESTESSTGSATSTETSDETVPEQN